MGKIETLTKRHGGKMMHYYDPMFYLCSENMPFGIRIEVTLKYIIDGNILEYAVNTAIKRYPYFSVRTAISDGDLVTVPNDLPIKVFKGSLPYPLGSPEVNHHVTAFSYTENQINFYITHVITDGSGFVPFIKTVLYYYLCKFLNTDLPHAGIRLVDDPLLEGETENPYPEQKMQTAVPFYTVPQKEFFRLTDGGYVADNMQTSYNFRAKESDVMKFSHENDGSPCALFSTVMAKAIRDVHPNETKDLVSAISFNLRSGLGSQNNYRMLCNAIMVRYPKRLNDSAVRNICTCTRGSIMLQSQPENVLYYAKRKKEQLEAVLKLPDVRAKKAMLSKIALADSVNNTFSVSYVGRIDYGSLQEHVESVRNYTDGSTYKTLFIEISSFNGWFYVTVLQGFSCDVYYRALLKQLKQNDIAYIEDGCVPMDTPKIVLPS